jgi:hypothetical protein
MITPQTPEERARMVEEEAERRCVRYGPGPDQGVPVPCSSCQREAETIVPPVAPQPQRAGACPKCFGQVFHRPGKPGEYDHDCPPASVALVTADEYSTWLGPRDSSLLATLRHYEDRVGQLETELFITTGKMMARQEAKLALFDADCFKKIIAREAPFAALGREVAKIDATLAPPRKQEDFVSIDRKLLPSLAAARAVLAAESEPEWSEPAPSGNRYQMRGNDLWSNDHDEMWKPEQVPVVDAAFVTALMESNGGKDAK